MFHRHEFLKHLKNYKMPRRLLKNRTIEVILLQQDKHLGEKYQVVRVKPSFARNVLLPKGIVVLADKANLNKYQQKMEAAKKTLANKASSLDDLLNKIQSDGGISLTRKANKESVLYAQISDEDIAKEIKAIYKIDVEAHYFKIKKKIKMIGEYNVPFIFQDLKKEIRITILKEKDSEKDSEEAKKNTKTTEEKKEDLKETEVKNVEEKVEEKKEEEKIK